jgi:hypothetical protein
MRKHDPPAEPGPPLPHRLVKDGWWLAASPDGPSGTVVPFRKIPDKPGAAAEKRPTRRTPR